MWGDIALVGVIGGLIALDRSSALQVMISRPLVSGVIIGVLLGHPTLGLAIGGMLELIWINRLPLGGLIPPHETLATVVICSGVILSSIPPDNSLISLGIMIGFPLARLSVLLEIQLRHANAYLTRKAFLAVTSGRPQRLMPLNLAGLLLYLGCFSLTIMVLCFLMIQALNFAYPLLPPPVLKGLNFMYFVIPILGIAAALSSVNIKRSLLYFTFLYGLAIIILFL